MPLTKLTSLGITDGTIVNADINASAAIAASKLSGVGKVLQVVTATTTSPTTTTSTSFVTTNLSVSITPSSTSSRVLVLVTSGSFYNSVIGYALICTIYRGSTNLGATGYGTGLNWGASSRIQAVGTTGVIDSPSSTSSLTYALYIKAENASGSVTHISNSDLATIVAMEIGA